MNPVRLTLCALALPTAGFAAEEFADPLRALAKSELQAIAAMPALVDAVVARNTETGGLSADEITDLDNAWRAAVDVNGPMIAEILALPLSQELAGLREDSAGLYTEIFVTDAKGLNVAQSDPTSDYWQGDEAKWQVPFNEDRMHLSEVEFDESSQTYQSQVSLPVHDPETGAPIGAITFGINVEYLPL